MQTSDFSVVYGGGTSREVVEAPGVVFAVVDDEGRRYGGGDEVNGRVVGGGACGDVRQVLNEIVVVDRETIRLAAVVAGVGGGRIRGAASEGGEGIGRRNGVLSVGAGGGVGGDDDTVVHVNVVARFSLFNLISEDLELKRELGFSTPTIF
jgi:hypothetical protein